MKNKIKELVILGFSPGSVCNITEAAYELFGCTSFKIIKNIDVQEKDVPYLHQSLTCTIYDLDSIQENPVNINLQHVHFGVNHSHIRPIIFNEFNKKLGIDRENYVSLIHPTSHISMSSDYKEGFFAEPNSVVSSFSELGFGVNIKRGSSVGHHCKLGDYVTLNPGAILSGFVNVGEGTEIGTGVSVLHEISIGKNCMIGAGSVVTRDIPDGVVAYGNPCKVIRKNERWEKTKSLLKQI